MLAKVGFLLLIAVTLARSNTVLKTNVAVSNLFSHLNPFRPTLDDVTAVDPIPLIDPVPILDPVPVGDPIPIEGPIPVDPVPVHPHVPLGPGPVILPNPLPPTKPYPPSSPPIQPFPPARPLPPMPPTSTICQINEIYLPQGIAPNCDTVCSTLTEPCNIFFFLPPSGCYCLPNYARDSQNVCVPISECPILCTPL